MSRKEFQQETQTFQIPKKYGDMKKYRVDMLFTIKNESDPANGLPERFILIRQRLSGKIEAIYDK